MTYKLDISSFAFSAFVTSFVRGLKKDMNGFIKINFEIGGSAPLQKPVTKALEDGAIHCKIIIVVR